MKTKIVAKRAGTKANKDDHQGLFPNGCTNQLRSVNVGENVAGTFNFGVSTLSQTSKPVIVIMAMITEKSAKILRTFHSALKLEKSAISNFKFKITKNAIFGLFSGAKIDFFAIFEIAKNIFCTFEIALFSNFRVLCGVGLQILLYKAGFLCFRPL